MGLFNKNRQVRKYALKAMGKAMGRINVKNLRRRAHHSIIQAAGNNANEGKPIEQTKAVNKYSTTRDVVMASPEFPM
jgi:hypothetical protein